MNALVNIKNLKPEIIFSEDSQELERVLIDIRKYTKSLVFDVETVTGRAEIASLAHKVAKSKVALEKLGKDFVSELKDKAKIVDNGRSHMRKSLETLKDEIRKPLTDFEDKEKKRISDIELKIVELENIYDSYGSYSLVELNTLEKMLLDFAIGEDFAEFKDSANYTRSEKLREIQAEIEKEKKVILEKAELEKLREADEKRKREEREENIRKEASDKKERELKEEVKKANREKIAAEEREKIEKENAKQFKIDQELKEKAAEKKRIEDKKQAELDKKKAIEKEKQRVEAEAAYKIECEKLEEEKRKKNKEHHGKINREAFTAIMKNIDIDEESAKFIIGLIVKNKIPHVSIRY